MSIFGKDYDKEKVLGHFDEDEGDDLIPEEEFDRNTLFDAKYAEFKHVSELSFGIDRIPEKLQGRAQKVFSKHQSKEVREWSAQLMKSYQMLHAVEKPMNLNYVKPFANTSDLVKFTPNIDEKLAAAKEQERIYQMKQRQKNPDEAPAQEIILEEESVAEQEIQTEGASAKTKKSKNEQKEEKQA